MKSYEARRPSVYTDFDRPFLVRVALGACSLNFVEIVSRVGVGADEQTVNTARAGSQAHNGNVAQSGEAYRRPHKLSLLRPRPHFLASG